MSASTLKQKLLIFLALLPCLSFSQFKSIDFGVNGLTCSACSRSVEMSIRKLDFVEDVKMNLSNTNGKITLKKGVPVSIDKIAKAVTDAGFSVRYLNATFKFDPITISDNYCFTYENSHYQFVDTGTKKLDENTVLKFIGKQYLPKKELKKEWKNIQPQCKDDKLKTYFITTSPL